tara:strand:- start:668 stop:1147 length:480 start_codon:yes stop_codon:yes gene_type:complete
MSEGRFVLYRFYDGNSKLKYAVLEKKEFDLLKLVDRDLCCRTISVGTDEKSLECASIELNKLGRELEEEWENQWNKMDNGGLIEATSEYTFNELRKMPYEKLEKYFMKFYGYDGREEFEEMYENQFEGKNEKQKKEILIDNFKDYNYSGKFDSGREINN